MKPRASDQQLDLFRRGQAAGARPALPDQESRRRIREDLDTTLFVEAAAGTGKTSELVGRIIAVLLSGRTTLSRMVALTFTDKAAGELKLRLREEIERERRDASGAPRQHLDAALRELEAAQIGTIHSFCAELLRERPVQAAVDPLFEMAAEDAAEQLLEEAFEGWFQEVLSSPPEGVRRVLRRRGRGRDGSGPRDLLRRAATQLADHRDFTRPWQRPEGFQREAAIDAALARLEALAELGSHAEHPDDYLARSLREIGQFVEEQHALEAMRGRDHDGLEAMLRELLTRRLWTWSGKPSLRRFAPGADRDAVLQQREEARAALEELFASADADLAALVQQELQPVIARYERLKSHCGVLDFLDLLLRARDLVRDRPEVRADLRARFSHFFVDEFQDTDPLQVELLLLLAADDPQETDWRTARVTPGKLFLVGDPKQSIYRFRRADVTLYETVKQRLLAQGAALISLEASFRAVPAIQEAINAAFAPVMAGQAGGEQARYVPLRPVREDPALQPTVIALPVPRPYSSSSWGRARVTQRQIEESYPDAVGAFIDWLINESGWTVHDRERDARVPVEARHICLLFRRFAAFGTDLTRPYVRALEGRRVPHVVVGGRSFHAREEVLALRNALTAIEWPDDELSVFAALRGPFFALADDQLLAFRHRRGRLHPLLRVPDEEIADDEREVMGALRLLGELHPRRNRRPLAATLLQLLEGVRAHAAIALWPTGEQALANVLQLLDLSRRFEAGGATSFRSFIDWLEEAAEQSRAQEAPVVEEGTEGVRMMTVHKAKGLEFPVVILVDPTAALTRRHPSRHVDPERGLWAEPLAGCSPRDLALHADLELQRDSEEEIRLAYVAATRARDLLVAPVIGDSCERPGPWWLDVLNPALHPPFERQRNPAPAPGCPRFGSDSVLDRPASAEAMPDSSVAPGLHRPRAGTQNVVWWDPGLLRLDVEERFGLTQQRLLEAVEKAEPAESAAREHRRWRSRREAGLQRGAQPLLSVESVTRTVHRQAVAAEAAVELLRTDAPRDGRPAGKRFGTLVHAVLAEVALEAGAEIVAAVADLQGRMLGAPQAEVDAAAQAALAALAHPLLREAARSPEVRREAPITLRLEEGHLLEGIVDLAFREPAGEAWCVVDFKTDSPHETERQAYEAQVRLYLEAVTRSTGARARGVLLFV